MKEARYKQIFGQFLDEYWGAFHEVIEAESVNPERVAGSLFDQVVAQHERFVQVSPAAVMPDVEALGRLWRQVTNRRIIRADEPLTSAQVREALARFQAIYDTLLGMGASFPAARTEALAKARHAHPRAPLRAAVER
jgi:hypothetical protein